MNKKANSVKILKFKSLDDLPLTAWLAAKGWAWFPHQVETFKAAQKGANILLCAPTGAGKTLSGFLPSFADLLSTDKREGLHTLYISPLKALTVDVHRNIGKPIAEMNLPITFESRTGDTPANRRVRQKNKPPDMLMTTPESLALLTSYPDSHDYFQHLRFVIIDELHALMPTKRGDLLALNLARLKRLAPNVQLIGLSATIPDPELALDWLCGRMGVIVKAPSRVQPDIHILKSEKRIPWSGHMAQYAMPEVYAELCDSKMSIVFVNTRAQAELIFQFLWRLNDKNLKIGLHHGSLEPTLRRKVEESMAKGLLDCVVATSSLDLGIDWAEVDLVVQIGAPKGISRLLQRIGRSNHRHNEPSRALLVPTNRFECIECQATVEAIKDKELDGTGVRTGGLDVLAQHILGTACHGPFLPDPLYQEVITAWPYRDLSRDDFDQCLRFVVDGGYVLKNYDRFKKLEMDEEGAYRITAPAYARQYRMNIGTIVESPMLKVKRGRQFLGMIDESFINNLSEGDTFLFAGGVMRFDGMKNGVVEVSAGSGSTPKIPSYPGNKFAMTSALAHRVRDVLENPHLWQGLPETVDDWLRLQAERSRLPDNDEMLVELFRRGGKNYMVLYPFAGRNAHQTLGFLLMRRMKREGLKPLGFVASDYALAVWGLRPVTDVEALLSTDLLGEELHDWLIDTPLLKRTFREAAVISGAIERRHPGQQKTGRQMSFSSDLIYDVLLKYEPKHLLLRAAYQDAMGGLIDIGRLTEMLNSVQGKIVVEKLERVSPLSVPLILDIARESVAKKDKGEYYLEDLEEDLLAEAGFAPSEIVHRPRLRDAPQDETGIMS